MVEHRLTLDDNAVSTFVYIIPPAHGDLCYKHKNEIEE